MIMEILKDVYSQSNNFFYLCAMAFVLCMGCKRRKHFVLRALVALALGTAATYLYSMLGDAEWPLALFYISKYALCFALVLAAMLLSFKADFAMIVYFCICGYSFQHLCFNLTLIAQSVATLAGASVPVGSDAFILTEILITAAVFCFVLLVYRRLISHEYETARGEKLLLPFAILIAFAIVLCVFGFDSTPSVRALISAYAALLCVSLLYAMYKVSQVAHASYEKQTAQAIAVKQKEQYDAYKKNIDYINIKCHDLKRQLELLRGSRVSDENIAEMSEKLRIYDNTADTGNETLDVILTDKSMQCERENILFTYMADGGRLSFMDTTDICAIFCNVLDNAVEAASAVTAPERRTVSLKVRALGNLVHISAVNGCDRPPVRDEHGYVTTKSDKTAHGFGLKSIAETVRKYDGEMRIDVSDGTFGIDILIPFDK